MGGVIRPATRADVPTILRFIRELAEYEKLSHEVVATEEALELHLFGTRAFAECMIAVNLSEDRREEVPVGFCLFFTNFSTFLGKPGLYLEDLYVTPTARGRGHGKAMMVALAGLADQRGYGRFEWSVLDWNKSSIDFYKQLGAVALDDWTVHRLTPVAMRMVAQL